MDILCDGETLPSTAPGRADCTPRDFFLVAKGVYRGSYPNIRDFSFMTNLELKTVLFLGPEDDPQKSARFLDDNESFKTIPPEQMMEALGHITNARNHRSTSTAPKALTGRERSSDA